MAEQDFIEQARTLDAAKKLLRDKHKAVIIRPTGFGKTWMLTELIKDYKNVLYLYPSAVIRDTVVNRYYDTMYDGDLCGYVDENGEPIDPETIRLSIEMKQIDNCTLMTYAKLRLLTSADFDDMDYDLVIFDECHKMGGTKTKIAIEKLFASLGATADFIGATATPTRMDYFDVVSYFFADNMVYTYTLFDAMNDKLVPKLNYCYATYDFETDLKDAALTAGEDPTDPIVKEVISAKIIELSKIFNMPNIIRDICDKYATDTSYMKFIVFFANKKHMSNKMPEVENWFREAYPDHAINILRISSTNRTESENVSRLGELLPRNNNIDLIACIDMLNMGYHVNDQTGIIMYRGTSSTTIYTQQLGRALSVGMNNSAIVFDIVDNLHRKAVFRIQSRRRRKSLPRQNKCAMIATHYFLSEEDRSTLVFYDDDGNIVESQYHLDENNNIVDINNVPSTMVYDDETGIIYNLSDENDPRKNINTIDENCINAVGHEATYREIIAKAMAEPLIQKCRYALELHFRTWCYQHGVDYPITERQLKKFHDLNKKDFYNEFCQMLKDNHIRYPLHDIHALLNMGGNDEDVPLEICAKARNVSVTQILDMLGLTAETQEKTSPA